MSPAAATRDARFGPQALALAARCLDDAPGPRTRDGGSVVRVAFRADALDAADRQALAAAAAPAPSREDLWTGPAGALERLAAERPALLPLLAAVEGRLRPLPRPRVMGIVNATPDSFSDGGRYLDPAHAVAHALALVRDGADLLDVGGESTRPGAAPVPAEEELARVAPVIERLAAETDVPLSIDTTKAAVAERALDLGASFVNDVGAGRLDPRMLPLVAERGCDYCAMHMLGTPRTMQAAPRYDDPVAEIAESLRERVAACVEAGVDPARIVVDPGIGFGKLVEHNVELIRRLGELRSLGLPLLVGVSNKSFLGRLGGEPADAPAAERPPKRYWDRTGGTAAAVAACVLGGAAILRVHDVRTMVQAVRVAAALRPLEPAADPDPSDDEGAHP